MISWISFGFCALMGVFQLVLAAINTGKSQSGLALMNTVLAIVCFVAAVVNVPFALGVWA